jgi:hypothetical protein
LPGTGFSRDISDGKARVKDGPVAEPQRSCTETAMREILKSNNAVELNFAEVVLKDAGIASVVLDTHMSILDGSMVIIPRRLMVADADEASARTILEEALGSRAEWA